MHVEGGKEGGARHVGAASDTGVMMIKRVPGTPLVKPVCARAVGGSSGGPRSGRYGRVQWRSSVTATRQGMWL